MEPFSPATKQELISAIRESQPVRLARGRGDINTWNLISINDLSYLFADNTTFNEDISDWDVSHVINMESMFSNARSFNQNISKWKVPRVRKMNSMFYNASAFNQELSLWGRYLNNVTDMGLMFAGASSFNGLLTGWDVSQVHNMGGMFEDSAFNQPILDWDVSNVVSMVYMFKSTPFNQDISDWNVSSVNDMSSMFNGANKFNQNLDKWSTRLSNVTEMSNMFLNATSFCQSLEQWQVPQLQIFGASNSKITEMFQIPTTLYSLEVNNCKLTRLRIPSAHGIVYLKCTGNPFDMPTIQRLVEFYQHLPADEDEQDPEEYTRSLQYFRQRLLEKQAALNLSGVPGGITARHAPFKVPNDVAAEVTKFLGGKKSKKYKTKGKKYKTKSKKYKVQQNKKFR